MPRATLADIRTVRTTDNPNAYSRPWIAYVGGYLLRDAHGKPRRYAWEHNARHEALCMLATINGGCLRNPHSG